MTQLANESEPETNQEVESSSEQAQEDKTAPKSTPKESTSLKGEDALSLVSPLSDLAFYVAAPNQKPIKCRSKYVGMHSNNYVLFETPEITQEQFQLYFRKGYPVKACALSQRGEGARIYFRSKIDFIMPIEGSGKSIVFVNLPKTADVVFGIRAEARLEIAIPGVVNPNKDKHTCEIRDFSSSGCQIVIDVKYNNYKLGDDIDVKLDGEEGKETILHGTIKNKKRSNHYWKYGVQFSDESSEASEELLNRLSFDEGLSRYHL